LTGSIYLDTNILIAMFEGRREIHGDLWEFMNEAIRSSKVVFHASALSFAELLVKPYRERNEHLSLQYMQLARSDDWLRVHRVDPIVIETAAALRALTRASLPDAVHMATAMSAACSYLMTFDLGITDLPDLEHPISGRPFGRGIQVIHPSPTSLSELAQALS
jgi:predicted nucleic acid-binding protein